MLDALKDTLAEATGWKLTPREARKLAVELILGPVTVSD